MNIVPVAFTVKQPQILILATSASLGLGMTILTAQSTMKRRKVIKYFPVQTNQIPKRTHHGAGTSDFHTKKIAYFTSLIIGEILK